MNKSKQNNTKRYIKARAKYLNIAKKLEAVRKYKKSAHFYLKVYKYDKKIFEHDFTSAESLKNLYYVQQSFFCWYSIKKEYKLTEHRYHQFSQFSMPDFNRNVEALDINGLKYFLYIDKIGTWRDSIIGSEIIVNIEKWRYVKP